MNQFILVSFALSLFLCPAIAKAQGSGGHIRKSTKASPSKTSIGRGQSPAESAAKIDMVWVPAGSFMMGFDSGQDNERPAHQVSIANGFYIGKYEVTQAQWSSLMGNNPSQFKGESLPVEMVSWDDALAFIALLNARNDGFTYRLPTEAEWEYACRGGTTGDYAGNIEDMAWYGNNSGKARLDVAEIYRTDSSPYLRLMKNGGRTHAVGRKLPNSFGLYDMHGNVAEWCQDWYHDSYDSAPSDGSAWAAGGDEHYRIVRGGSWFYLAEVTRSAYRFWVEPSRRVNYIGFRVVAVKQTRTDRPVAHHSSQVERSSGTKR